MSHYCYEAYGLIFQSELVLPELVVGQGAHDVVIRFGEVPVENNF